MKYCLECCKRTFIMNPPVQLNLSHIIGQAVDVANYASFQHQLHGYSNISVPSLGSNVLPAGTRSVHEVDATTGPIAGTSTVMAVDYAQQQQTVPLQSYHAVFNNVAVTHIAPQVPPPQVQYFSYETPGMTLRTHTIHSQVSFQAPPLPSISHMDIPHDINRYEGCAVSVQAVNSALPLNCTLSGHKELSSNSAVTSCEATRDTKKKRKEGGSAKLDRKARRNRGEAYMNASGKLVEARRYVDKDCMCKSKCIMKLGTLADRQNIFNHFWKIGNFSEQNAYLSENVILVPNKSKKQRNPAAAADEKSLKTVTRLYYVRELDENKKIRICKTMFLSLHGVSNGRLDRVLQAVNCELPDALQDRRGHHKPSNKTSDEDIQFVVNHISSVRFSRPRGLLSTHIPVEESTQNQLTNEIPLNCGRETSVKKMYEFYKRVCKEEGRTPVSLWVYRQIEKSTASQSENDQVHEPLQDANVCNSRQATIIASHGHNAGSNIVTESHMTASNNHSGGNNVLQERFSDTENITTVSYTCKTNKSIDSIVPTTRKERKIKRNSGSSYVTARGKLKTEKSYSDRECGCKYKCIPEIGDSESRKMIFDRFWKLADFSKQNAYIAKNVVLVPVMQKCGNKTSEKYAKTCSRIYYVDLKPGNESIRVCKMAFLQLHGVSNGRVDRVLQSVACESPYALQDRRGHHAPKNKTGEDDINYAGSHMRSFLIECPSSLGSSETEFYLPHNFNVQKMYRLYKEKCAQDERVPIGCFVYRKILKARFKCSIRSPANKTPEEDLEFAYQHISMCISSNTDTQTATYQANHVISLQDTSMKKLHCDYVHKCIQEGRKPVGIDVYRKICNTRCDINKTVTCNN